MGRSTGPYIEVMLCIWGAVLLVAVTPHARKRRQFVSKCPGLPVFLRVSRSSLSMPHSLVSQWFYDAVRT